MLNYKAISKYMFYCHRMPERSFFIKGYQFPVCARCTGILLGYIVGLIYVTFWRKFNYILELSLIFPMLIDGIGQYRGYFVSTNIRRLITGILAGISVICFFRLLIILWITSLQWVQDYILNLLL